MKDNFRPCLDENCSDCCNPVKVDRFFPENKVPIDEKGERIWEYQGLLTLAETPDGIKLKAYKCKNFDEKTGLCKDYENRPQICKDTVCDEEKFREIRDKQKDQNKNKFIFINAK